MKMRRKVTVPRLYRFLVALAIEPIDRPFALTDLEDEFEVILRRDGMRAARRWYRRQAFRSLAPGVRHRLSRWLRHKPLQSKMRQTSIAIGTTLVPDLPRGGNAMSHVLSDVRFGLRSLTKTPLATLVTVVSLSLGIGATTTVFTVTNALLFRQQGGQTPSEDLVTVYTSEADGDIYGQNSFPDFQNAFDDVTAFRAATAIRLGAVNMGEATPPRRLLAEIVTGDYFRVLGIPLRLGRGFLPEETIVGSAERIVVISHRLWQEQFSESPEALGQTLRLNGHDFTVVGIAPEGMVSRLLALKVDVWVPIGMPGGTFRATPEALENRGDRDFQVVARLKEAATIEQAQAQLSVLGGRLSSAHPDEWTDDRGNARVFTVLSDAESRIPPNLKLAIGALSGFLFAIAGTILLIACTNVAGIFLARAEQRQREMAVRASLGAGRLRLIAMLITESLLPALAGGTAGILLAIAASRAMGTFSLPMGIPIEFDFSVDHRVLAFVFAVSVASCLFFGLVPALRASRPNLVPSLKSVCGSGGRKAGRFGLRNILIVGQVALSLVLLVSAALSIRTVQGATNMDLGFDVERIALMSKRLPREAATPEARVQSAKDLAGQLSAHPEVEEAHLTRVAEGTLFSNLANASVSVGAYEPSESELTTVSYNTVTPGYLKMLGIHLLGGRTFTDADVLGASAVAVVNESFMRRFWPGASGLGRRFTAASRRGGQDLTGEPEKTFEVIGVVADGRYVDIEDTAVPYFWTSLYQDSPEDVLIHVKGRTSAESMLEVLRTEVRLDDDELPMILPSTFEGMTSVAAAMYRILGKILGAGGLFGLILVSVGIYGIVSYSVTQRAREMAIRQAIGAQRAHVVRSVARDGIKLSVVGSLVGLAIAVPLVRVGESTTFGVSPLDPVAFTFGVCLLLAAAVAASLVPARRITKLDPMKLLRED
jgi:predicted permease